MDIFIGLIEQKFFNLFDFFSEGEDNVASHVIEFYTQILLYFATPIVLIKSICITIHY